LSRQKKVRKGEEQPAIPFSFRPEWVPILFAFFVLALAPRLYGSLTFGANLDGPGTFQVINYDEGGSCRAALGAFKYPTFVGQQIVAIASALGYAPPRTPTGRQWEKSYCQSRPLIVIQRVYSAILGSLTVVLLGLISLMTWPNRAEIAWTACALLALSSFHVAQSHSGTVDASQVFFIYLLVSILTYVVASPRQWSLILSPMALICAVWVKWYVFAVFAYAGVLAQLDFKKRSVRGVAVVVAVVAVGAVALGWDDIMEVISRRRALFWGNETTRFGTGYANIGTWRRWIRNAVNLPVVHIVGLGLPACLFVWTGLKHALADRVRRPLWLAHAPAAVYGAYMLLLGPITYYRYYLPLFPVTVLLASYGFWESGWSRRKLFLILFLIYPALLTLDSEYNYRNDPRREVRPWYAKHSDARLYATYYVVPPKAAKQVRLFNPDSYLRYGNRYLGAADYLILSENWYDTAFPNELNGPIAWRPEWLIKTTPEYALTYRRILSNQDPSLKLEVEFKLKHFMPEFLLHRLFYGSFQLFVGDLRIYRVVAESEPTS